MVKKENKILWFAINLGASEAAQFGFFEDWRILAIRKSWQDVGTGGCTYFVLLVDRFITYTNKILALVRPGPNYNSDL